LFETVQLECHQAPSAFIHPQNTPKSLAAGASPQTPLWELTALPRLPSWIKGATSKGRGKGGDERRGNGRGREGLWSDPHNVGNRLTPMNDVILS